MISGVYSSETAIQNVVNKTLIVCIKKTTKYVMNFHSQNDLNGDLYWGVYHNTFY